ncbi:hypothetical protein KBC80_02135 [Candidatus Woesebacteria bacterium]|jgi:hypothetical protein|nr:hypothetical protein [Candidatus Woesebacteria bacterium]
MKAKIIILLVLLASGFFGYQYWNSQSAQQAPQGIAFEATAQPSGSVNADVCIGSAEFCQGVADAKKLELENAQKQYEQMLAANAPVPTPTLSPEQIANQQNEDNARSNVFITALWAVVVIAILYAVVWGLYQLYWHYRVKIPKEEIAPDIREKDGLIVARIPGDPNHANQADQFIVVDVRAYGTQMVHIDPNGVAHQLKLSDYVGAHVAMSHAISDASSRDQARQLLATVLEGWNKGTAMQLGALGDFAERWRGTGPARTRTPARSVPTKMRHLEKGESVAKDGSQAGASVTWEGVKKDK